MLTHRGTQGYYAPEIVLGRCWNERVDIWALGLCLFFMMRTVLPFNVMKAQVQASFIDGFLPEVDWGNVAIEHQSLIEQCLAVDMRDRPPAMELKQHPVLKDQDMAIRRRLSALSGTVNEALFVGTSPASDDGDLEATARREEAQATFRPWSCPPANFPQFDEDDEATVEELQMPFSKQLSNQTASSFAEYFPSGLLRPRDCSQLLTESGDLSTVSTARTMSSFVWQQAKARQQEDAFQAVVVRPPDDPAPTARRPCRPRPRPILPNDAGVKPSFLHSFTSEGLDAGADSHEGRAGAVALRKLAYRKFERSLVYFWRSRSAGVK